MKSTVGRMLTVAIATVCAAAAYAGDSTTHDGKWKMMDTNQDGKISQAEHTAGAQQMFQRMDTNQDGRVTAEEMDASRKDMKSADARHDGKMHGMTAAEKIKAIDSDGDGVLTTQEHAKGSQKRFTKMDADKDGSLTAAEMKAGHDSMTAHEE